MERGSNRAHAFGELVDEELYRIVVTGHLFVNGFARGAVKRVVFEQGLWMHADHAVNDELEPGQADAMVRNIGEIKCPIRVTDVHHDLDRDIRQRIELDQSLLEVQFASINSSLITFCTTDCDVGAINYRFGCIATANNVKSGEALRPAALGDDVGEIAPDDDPRLRLADWMSSKENPFFAQIYYPNHDRDEDNTYDARCFEDIL